MKKLIRIFLLLSSVALLVFYLSNRQDHLDTGADALEDQEVAIPSADSKDVTMPRQKESLSEGASHRVGASAQDTEVIAYPPSSPSSPAASGAHTISQQGQAAERSAVVEPDNQHIERADESGSATSATESGRSQGTPVSIPVEQAAYYFIPKEQRSPGNLGGPPPLPTVSAVPASSGTPAAIKPPAAPGASSPAATPSGNTESSAPAQSEPQGTTNPLTPPPAFQ